MKEGWAIKTLDQISVNLDHKRVPITKSDRAAGQFPYYGASGIVDYVADFIFEGDALLVSEDGANLLARSSPIAFPATGRYWVNNHAHILKFDEPTMQRYVELYMESIRLDEYITGAAQPKLNQKALNSIPIPVAPPAEQRRIIAILDEAFEGIATVRANAEKNLRNARELFEGHHQSTFARARERSSDQRLGDIAGFRNGINYTKQSKGRLVRIIGVRNFQDYLWAPTDHLDSITLDGELSAADAVEEGDILSVRSNGNPELIGRCMLVGKLSGLVTHSGFTIRIRVHSRGCLPQYVCQFLKSREVRRKLVDGGTGLNIKSLNQGMLSDLVIPLPPVDVQRGLIAELKAMKEATEELADIATRKLAAIDELKKSLLRRAFTGALTAKYAEEHVAEIV